MMHFLPKSEAKKIMAGWMAEANGTAKNTAELKEPPEELAKLGPWKCTATTAKAVHVTKTQAAQLAPSTLADSDVLRLKNWKTIIRQISKGRSPLAAAILRDVEFWHHQSTNGRWNAALGRYERWVVRSVEGWLDKLQDGDKRPSRRTFIRAKDELVQAGLIEAEGHHWQGKRCLWIKPTEELSRILFEPGRWEAVRGSYVTSKPKRPRGNSATRARYLAEAEAIYQKAREYDLPGMSTDERWKLFRRLTEPQKISEKHTLQPFAPAGSHRHQVLRERLLP